MVPVVRLVGFAALGGIIGGLVALPRDTAMAHSLTFVQTSLQLVCVGGGSSYGTWIYERQSPVDKTWTARTSVFLQNGDRYQDAYFRATLYDNYNGYDVADFRHAARDWFPLGSARFTGSMTAHVASSFSLWINIANPDIFGQCFYVLGNAGYQ